MTYTYNMYPIIKLPRMQLCCKQTNKFCKTIFIITSCELNRFSKFNIKSVVIIFILENKLFNNPVCSWLKSTIRYYKYNRKIFQQLTS